MVTWEELVRVIIKVKTESGINNENNLSIELETKLIEDLKFDSLAIIQLFMEVEEQFGVDFTDLEDFAERFNLCGLLFEGIIELQSKKQCGEKNV